MKTPVTDIMVAPRLLLSHAKAACWCVLPRRSVSRIQRFGNVCCAALTAIKALFFYALLFTATHAAVHSARGTYPLLRRTLLFTTGYLDTLPAITCLRGHRATLHPLHPHTYLWWRTFLRTVGHATHGVTYLV